MTEQDNSNSAPDEKLCRDVHLALVALGLKMPTTEEEVVLAMRGHQLDKTPLPEHYRATRNGPDQVPTRTHSREPQQQHEQRPRHLPEL